MPYFFILPVYVLVLLGLLALALVARFVPRLRDYSSYIALGAIGTIPGFIVGNALLWGCIVALAVILKKPLDHVDGALRAGASIGFALGIVVGIVVANIGGCVVGFLSGIWLGRILKRKTA